MDKANLVTLLEVDMQARAFYLALPGDIRGKISRNPEGIGTFADLRARAREAALGR